MQRAGLAALATTWTLSAVSEMRTFLVLDYAERLKELPQRHADVLLQFLAAACFVALGYPVDEPNRSVPSHCSCLGSFRRLHQE